jgi:hypothetical protein
MILVYSTWRTKLLCALAIFVIAGYCGVLAPVQQRLEDFAKTEPVVRAASQPGVATIFKGPEARAEAYFVVFLFMFLSPLALTMVAVLLIIALTALAGMLAPLLGGEKVALLIVEILGAIVIYVQRGLWLPHANYVVGLLARAYVVIAA